jgi:hypothetical protein
MIDVKLPVDLTSMNLSSALPLLALIIIATLILITLLARSIVRSKWIVIALIVAIVMGGSSVIVGGLQALTGLLAVAGLLVIALLILMARQPVLLDLTRAAVQGLRPDPKPMPWTHVIDQPAQSQLAASSTELIRLTHRVRSKRLPKSMGF